ncbi:MAG: acyltransferase [Chlorobi bacterium]|nr:acyltransferase [Chlorobiota bacterium]
MSRLLEKFRRVSSQRYLAEVDGLRFLAILPVVLLHFRTAFLRFNGRYDYESLSGVGKIVDKFILTGDVGVPVFFAISGFILTLPFASHYLNGDRKVSVKRYFMRRLTRLEPPYIITLIIFFFVHLALQTNPTALLIKSFFASLFYSHNWIFGTWSYINPVAWSLEIEVQFYILVPLITMLFRVNKPILRFVVLLLLLSIFPVLKSVINVHVLSLIGFGQYFVIGIIVADIYLRYDELPVSKTLLDISGFVSIILIFVFKYYKLYLLLPLAVFIVFISVLYGSRIKRIFSNQLISVIGGMCYITYLIHYSLITGVMMIFPDITSGLGYWADFILYGIIIIPVVIVISGLAFLILEKPFMDHTWPIKLKKFVKSRISVNVKN